MAIHYSTKALNTLNAAANPAKPSNLVSGLDQRVKLHYYEVSLPADAAADELVYVTESLPVGAQIVPQVSSVSLSGSVGSGALALDVGLVAEDDLGTLLDVASGVITAFDGSGPITTTSTKTQVVAKLETLTGDVGAVTMYFVIGIIGY